MKALPWSLESKKNKGLVQLCHKKKLKKFFF
jgi:hypothetical protein